MAAPKTLTERLEAIINSLGATTLPELPRIKGQLIKLLRSVKLLEGGHATRKKEAKIAALKAENENLKVQLQAVQAQIEQYQSEQAEQDESERAIPLEQFDILRRLPSKHGGEGLTIPQIRREIGRRLDETEIRVDKLEKSGLIESHFADGEQFWRRTMLGNELVVAKRLAGEEEEGEGQQPRKHPDLSQMEHFVLLALAKGIRAPGEIEKYITKALPTVGKPITSAAMIVLVLIVLKGKEMVIDEATVGGPSRWRLLRSGEEYLAQRGEF
jgi:DNA-binding MarR family transcriptional regulator